MSLFGDRYTRSGPGIAKDAPKKKPFFLFWEIYFRKFWKMLWLNIITFIFCIPIVTIGPAITGMTKVLRSYSLEKNAFVFHDFWKGFSSNLKKSVPLGLLDILAVVSAFCSVYVYTALGDNAESGSWFYYGLCVISLSVVFVFLVMNFYAYPMIAATDLSFKNVIKNSFILTAVALKKNLLTLLAVALVVAVLVITALLNYYMLLLLVPVWALTFMGFIVVFNCYPQIQKYVIEPYYEEKGMDNPEYDYLKPMSADESIFTDKGGEETPVEPENEKKSKNKDKKSSGGGKGKGKIIS